MDESRIGSDGTANRRLAARAGMAAGLTACVLGLMIVGCVGCHGFGPGVAWHGGQSYPVAGSVDREIAYEGVTGIDLEAGSGNIEVVAVQGREGTARVQAEFRATDQAEADAVDVVTHRRNDGVLEVRVRNPEVREGRERSYVTRLTVETPWNVGRVIADTGSGSVTVRGGVNPGSTRDEASVGDTGSGEVIFDGHAGPIVADTGSGSVRVLNPAGEVWADTGSGSVTIERTASPFHADTGSGSVLVTVLPGFSGWLAADTGSGRVRSAIPTIDNGGPRSKADTGSGDVTVRAAE